MRERKKKGESEKREGEKGTQKEKGNIIKTDTTLHDPANGALALVIAK